MFMSAWTLLVLHAAATFSLLGLIWVVQLVHYPSFAWVRREEFSRFAKFHVDRISFIVVPLMFLELFTGAGLCLLRPDRVPAPWAWAGLGMIAAIWLVTALVSVPMHRRLLQGFDEKALRLLLGWNWIRTGLWTLRSAGLIWVLGQI